MPRSSSRTSACLLPRPLVCAVDVIPLSPGGDCTDWSTIGQDHFASSLRGGGRSPGSMSRTRIIATFAFTMALAPVVVVAWFGARPGSLTPDQHFGLVGGTAALTSLASLLLSLAGTRARDGRAILMGTAFSTMTAL